MSPAARFWALALGTGTLSGLMLLVASLAPFGGVVLLYFAQLPLFAAGLALGATASAVAGTAAAGTVLVLRGYEIALVLGAMFILPVPILVRQALLSRQAPDGAVEWYPPGLLAGWLVGIGLVALAACGALLALGSGIEATARQIANWIMDVLSQAMPQRPSGEERTRGIENLTGFLLGTTVASMMVVTTINGTLAQGLLMRFGWNRRPAPDMARLDLPPTVPLLLGGFVLASWLLPGDFGYLARNAAPVILVGALLAGLAVAHAAVRRLEGRSWMLVLIYMIAAFMVLPMFLLAAIGLTEPFLNLKRRMLRAA